MNKLALLDLNGTIIKPLGSDDGGGWVTHPGEWEFCAGAMYALHLLGLNGWRIAVCTNQPAEHRFKHLIHERMEFVMRVVQNECEAAARQCIPFYACYHDDRCGCRKPAPGLLKFAMCGFDVPFDGFHKYSNWDIWMVGDTYDDMGAALEIEINTVKVGGIMVGDTTDYTFPYAPGEHEIRPTLFDAVVDILLCNRYPDEDLH